MCLQRDQASPASKPPPRRTMYPLKVIKDVSVEYRATLVTARPDQPLAAASRGDAQDPPGLFVVRSASSLAR
jgi:hypothetical protein